MKYNWIKINSIIFLSLSCSSLTLAGDDSHFVFKGMAEWLYLGLAALIILSALWALYKMMIMYFDRRAEEMLREKGLYVEHSPVKKQSLWSKWYQKATLYVPIEKEKDILLDHNYDGIQELDNNLPPWWLWMFYISIIYGIFYIFFFHFSPWQESNIQEYDKEMARAEIAKKEYLASKGDVIDENNLSAYTDEAELALGLAIYVNSCAVCHKPDGGGSVGPNFTDDYWINGGHIQDIFKTIKYGVPEKGMISWKSQLNPKQMLQVASYIKTLRGINPPGAKEPQGELYVEEEN